MQIARTLIAAFGVLAAVLAVVLLAAPHSDEAEAAPLPPFFASALGTKVIDGMPLRVHVVVAVEEGQDGRAIAEQAVLSLGAQPLSRADWTSLVDDDGLGGGGGVWWESLNGGDDTIVLEYSTLNEDLAGGKSEVVTAAASWTNISSSRLAFTFSGDVSICPSLVAECAGDQFLDGKNTFGWEALGPGILGVTWMVNDGEGGDLQESDIALSTAFNWTTGGSPFAINMETVALHEIGHVLGLGHSFVRRATMYTPYTRADTSLHGDDIDGISALYPVEGEPPPEPTPENDWCKAHPDHPQFDRKCP